MTENTHVHAATAGTASKVAVAVPVVHTQLVTLVVPVVPLPRITEAVTTEFCVMRASFSALVAAPIATYCPETRGRIAWGYRPELNDATLDILTSNVYNHFN